MKPTKYLGLLCVCFNLHSQEIDENQAALVQIADSALGNIPVTRQDSLFNGWEIVAGSDKKNASIKYAPSNGIHGISFTVSTPLDSEGNKANFYNTKTDAFANATSITFNVRRTHFLDPKPTNLSDLLTLCTSDPIAFGFKSTEVDKCFDQSLDELAKKVDINKAEANTKTIISNFKAEQSKMFLFYGGTATYSRKEFNYFKSESAITADTTENPWGVSAYVSFLKPQSYMFTIALEYQKGYETENSGKSVTRCVNPESTTNYTECVTAKLGAPKLEKNKNIKVSFRKTFDVMGQPVAIAPEYIFDFEDNAKTWNIPVYLFGNGDGGLTGGVRYDYDSSNDKGSIYSLFVGSKFDFQ